MRAWSEPDEMRVRFSISTGINAVSVVSSAVLVLGIITSKKLLKSPFNWYLLFISIPDCLGAFFCFWTCVLSIQKGEFYGEAMCGFQSFYLTWAFTANTWLNGRIVYEIHRLLRFSNIRKRYIPPTKQDVQIQAAGVYLYSLFWAILAGFNFNGFPMKSGNHRGFACYPIDSEGSVWFTLAIYMPLNILIPSFYAVGAMLHIWKRKLLPPEGRRRKIALFLLRVIGVYIVGWGPFLVVYFLLYAVDLNPWYQFSISMLSHLQGVVTAMVCYYTDEDLKASMKTIMTCGCCCGEDPEEEEEPFGLSNRFSKRFSTGFRSSRFGRMRKSSTAKFEILPTTMETAERNILPAVSIRKTEDPKAPRGDSDDGELSLQEALSTENKSNGRKRNKRERAVFGRVSTV